LKLWKLFAASPTCVPAPAVRSSSFTSTEKTLPSLKVPGGYRCQYEKTEHGMAQVSLHHGETLTLILPTLPRHNTCSLDINICIRLLSMLARSEVPIARKPTRRLPAVKAIDQTHAIRVLLAAGYVAVPPGPHAGTPTVFPAGLYLAQT
jgi:hypothetical protein